MDRARTEGALNHLGLFAFNWTRPRTNLSRGESRRAWKGERFVYAWQIRMPQILNHNSYARMNEYFRGCLILHPMVGQHTSLILAGLIANLK